MNSARAFVFWFAVCLLCIGSFERMMDLSILALFSLNEFETRTSSIRSRTKLLVFFDVCENIFAEKWSWSCKSIGRLNYVGREISGVARVWVLFFFSCFTFCFTLLRWFFIGVLSFFKLWDFSVQKTMEFCIRREF